MLFFFRREDTVNDLLGVNKLVKQSSFEPLMPDIDILNAIILGLASGTTLLLHGVDTVGIPIFEVSQSEFIRDNVREQEGPICELIELSASLVDLLRLRKHPRNDALSVGLVIHDRDMERELYGVVKSIAFLLVFPLTRVNQGPVLRTLSTTALVLVIQLTGRSHHQLVM